MRKVVLKMYFILDFPFADIDYEITRAIWCCKNLLEIKLMINTFFLLREIKKCHVTTITLHCLHIYYYL